MAETAIMGFASLDICPDAKLLNVGDKVRVNTQIAGLMGGGFSLFINKLP